MGVCSSSGGKSKVYASDHHSDSKATPGLPLGAGGHAWPDSDSDKSVDPFSTHADNKSLADAVPPSPKHSKLRRYKSDGALLQMGHGRLYRRRSKRGASNNRFGGASPSHHAEAPRTLPKRKTPLKMKSALIKDARGTAQGRIDDDGSWMERANRLVAQFRADGFLVGNEGDMMGHIDDNGHISVLRRSKATQIGSVLPDGTVTDKYTTLGHITGDGAVFNKFGKKIGSCDAGPEVAAVVHFFKNQLSRGSGARLARAESFGKMRTSGSSTKGY